MQNGLVNDVLKIPWEFNKIHNKIESNRPYIVAKGSNPYQLSHIITKGGKNISAFSHLANGVFNNIKRYHNSDIDIIRAKFNLLQNIRVDEPHWPHIDTIDDTTKVCIYYVNDSDGDTLIFNNTYPNANNLEVIERITPKQGKAIFFNSDQYHASSSPIKNEYRIVLNVIYRLVEKMEKIDG